MIYGPFSTGWRNGETERRNAARRAAWARLGLVVVVVTGAAFWWWVL